MEENNKDCSSLEHENTNAISFCPKCGIYLCKKCEIIHSKLLITHVIVNFDNNLDDNFTGFCIEKEHQNKLEFFCKNQNQVCCAACISKIKKNEIGNHKDCDVVLIEDIKNEKINKLNDNIKYLEKISKDIKEAHNKIVKILENTNTYKEKITKQIQKIFTKIRNELNNREDQLLFEVENKFSNLYMNEEILKQSEKLPNKVKISLEKGKNIDKNNKETELNSIIYQCLNIENNIKEINMIYEKIKNYENISNINYYFYAEKEEEITNILENIKNFGKICFPKKIKDYNLTKSLSLNSGICSIIILSNNDIAVGKRNGELVILDSIELKEITKIQAHVGGNTSIYSLLELEDKSIMTCGGHKTMKNYIYNYENKILIESQELICKDNSGYICRVIELPNHNLVSTDCANILIWKKDNKLR